MAIRGAGEALYIACEMEKRAIRLYERAMTVFAEGPLAEAIRAILGDEKNHLARFSQLGAGADGFARAQLLSARAARVLFPGGLMEAQRRGAFDSVQALLAYAAEEEKTAALQYGRFARELTGAAAAAFAAIESEEKQHLKKLLEWMDEGHR